MNLKSIDMSTKYSLNPYRTLEAANNRCVHLHILHGQGYYVCWSVERDAVCVNGKCLNLFSREQRFIEEWRVAAEAGSRLSYLRSRPVDPDVVLVLQILMLFLFFSQSIS